MDKLDQLSSAVVHLTSEVERLAEQVSELSKIVTQLARVEERSKNLEKMVDGFGARLTAAEHKLQTQEINTAVNTNTGGITARWVERLIGFIVIAALAAHNWIKGGQS